MPGAGDILCTIEKVDLDSEVGRYEALSYCWGTNEQPKNSIWLNGYPFEVFSNLYAALTQLRRPESTRRLWIDAICINQIANDGEAEKNTQIPLMGKIYHQAASVVIWLGAAEPEYDSDKTLDIVYHQNVEAMQPRKFATNFGRLLKRPWFRRTWIVQEFVLGKTLPQIMCGSRSVSFGNFMATHWLLPLLMNRFPDMDFVQLRKIVDSDGNVVSSKLFKRKLDFVWRNHDEVQNTLTALTNIREIVTDNDARLRPKPLYKILPLVKAFGVTYRKDKIYGVFGMVSPSVHESVQVDYRKTVAEVYRDAMTYMLRAQDDEPGAVDLYLEYPLSLSLESSTSDLPSWVPDSSCDSPFLRVHEDVTWYWLYHQNLNGHSPRLRKQHGRHTVIRNQIKRHLIFVDDTRLIVRGFLVDEVDVVVESKFFGLDRGMRTYSEQQMRSPSEADKNEGCQIKKWLDEHDKTQDETIPEIVSQADDPSILSASTLTQRYRTQCLHEIDELCRKKLSVSGRGVDSESWFTFIWRDLFEGYPTIMNVSEQEFDEQFYHLAQTERNMSGETWLSNLLKNNVRNPTELPQLNVPVRELFQPPRTFFTTRTSGFYGIGPPGVREGDKFAFLFPQAYMAFILRPLGENFCMVGPCIVPPRLRDRALEIFESSVNDGDELVII